MIATFRSLRIIAKYGSVSRLSVNNQKGTLVVKKKIAIFVAKSILIRDKKAANLWLTPLKIRYLTRLKNADVVLCFL